LRDCGAPSQCHQGVDERTAARELCTAASGIAGVD
jgi:hypothetical protein